MNDFIWASVIAAIPPTLAVWVSHRTQVRKLDAVHEVANSRLTEALAKIEALSLVIEKQRAEKNR